MEAVGIAAVGAALMVAGFLIGTNGALVLIFLGGVLLGSGLAQAVSR